MTHEETIKRIQELVPSVMELEFGCEVIDNMGIASRILEVIPTAHHRQEVKTEHDLEYVDELKILGKPITLSVIFQAIYATMNSLTRDDWEKQEKSHTLIDFYVTPDGGVVEPLWNLSRDNFNDQSEETKSFIRGLLGN